MIETGSSDHCHYVVPRKKRRCRMSIKPGNLYCGEHSHLLDGKTSTDKSHSDQCDDRIPCPLDSNHSCAAKRLKSHLQKCPSRVKDTPDFISKAANVPKTNVELHKRVTISSASDEDLLNVIEKVNRIYKELIEGTIKQEILTHSIIETEIQKEHIGSSASKHLIQNSSLLGHLEKEGVFQVCILILL